MDLFLAYFYKEWKIYEIFWNKMLYLDEESEGRDVSTHSKLSQVDQVSLPC